MVDEKQDSQVLQQIDVPHYYATELALTGGEAGVTVYFGQETAMFDPQDGISIEGRVKLYTATVYLSPFVASNLYGLLEKYLDNHVENIAPILGYKAKTKSDS